jgi:hypothetical protein
MRGERESFFPALPIVLASSAPSPLLRPAAQHRRRASSPLGLFCIFSGDSPASTTPAPLHRRSSALTYEIFSFLDLDLKFFFVPVLHLFFNFFCHFRSVLPTNFCGN